MTVSSKSMGNNEKDRSADIFSATDVAKLHNETNQLRHQQFLITLSALTIFGVFSALIILGVQKVFEIQLPTTSPKYIMPNYIIYLSITLTLILSFLFFWLRNLTKIILRIAIYLDITGLSKWEAYHAEFSKPDNNVTSQRGTMCLIFIILGVVSAIAPIIIGESLGVTLSCHHWVILITMAVGYLTYVSMLGFGSTIKDRNNINSQWVETFKHHKR